MKLELYFYVAQPKRDLYEVSMPWIDALSAPISGPSPSQLREEMMFRVMNLVHGGMPQEDLDRLLAPVEPYLSVVYADVQRQVEPDRPKVTLSFSSHVIVGGWADEDVTRLWLPKVPGVCLAVTAVEDMYPTIGRWAHEYANSYNIRSFEHLQTNYSAFIERMEVDFGFPPASVFLNEVELPGGRLTRPETLVQVATNLTHGIEDEQLGRSFGREAIVEELVEVITSPKPSSVCLVGPSGVGKTALVHEAAHRAYQLSKKYQERRDIWQTSGDRIIAGMSIIGQWEQRTEALARELTERGDMMFAEELLSLVRAGSTYSGDSNVGRFIEPYLDRNQFAVITEATDETYNIARTTAPGFVDKFRRIQVPELSYRDTLSVLTEQVRDLESTGNVAFVPDGIESILQLTRRFYRQDAYPGKAVRLARQCFHEASRDQTYSEEPQVIDADFVVDVVRRQTGLPPSILKPGTGRTPDEVKRAFSNRVFSQPDAIETVARLVLAIEQGVVDPERPLASLLLIGPSGVGKTETAKALASDLFGSEDRLIRFDMSEFSEPAAISRLIGTARHPDGELTSKVRLQPFCVLLFDEIEKAHFLVLDLLLQILGDGRLTDAAGRRVDFRNAIIVMTSNLGASTEDRWLGFNEVSDRGRAQHYRAAAEGFFRPEIFNRIDSIVPYRPLGSDALRKIARRTLQNLLERRGIRQAQMMIDVDDGLVEFLAKQSVDSRYGARALARRIEQTLINPLAHRLTEYGMNRGLTRVYLTPADVGVDFKFESIERAQLEVTDAEETGEMTMADLVAEMTALNSRVVALTEDPRTDQLASESADLLERVNAAASEGAFPTDLGEALRRRDSFAARLNRLEKRMVGLQDPRGTGEFIFVAKSTDRKKQSHRWAQVAGEIRRDIVWAECQLDDLAGDAGGGVFAVTGLSGNFGDDLQQWYQFAQALAEAFEFEISVAFKDSDGWRANIEPDFGALSAFAVASEEPGAFRLFQSLSGYVFYPLPPTQGANSLLLNRSIDAGVADSRALAEFMSRHIFGDEPSVIEFEVASASVRDHRLGVTTPIPEDRADNLQTFVSTLATSRIEKLSG